MRLSPDASQVALARSLGRWPVSYAGALGLRIRSEIAVVTLKAHPTVSVLGRLDDIRAPYFRWRPDGRALIAIAKKAYQPAEVEVVEMGVADPERLAVMGESYGGYATLSLIAQTNRFKAAIARAPGSNWISLYGVFAMFYRYSTFTHEDLSFFYEIETGQVQMKAPPWAEPTRYIQNSPIFYAHQVQTPVMIIQGDIDYVSIGQGEKFFTALYRQGKRARFVRYWGEGHNIDSPANIRDQWEQIFGWLNEHLKPASKTEMK
jgi:dipeptidyl aminopeptidase/acylaminoacyl peptidase